MIRSNLKPKLASLPGILRTANPKPLAKAALSTKPRSRKCKVCKTPFIKRSMSHVACSPACAIKVANITRAQVERKDIAKRKEAIKSRSKWMAEAQAAFNAFIRARDAKFPCISSGRPLQQEAAGGGFDAGHYRSIGSAPHLRFDERNVHGQSKQDNRYLAGNAVDYRIGLIKRIGIETVEALEADQEPRKWTIDDLKQIKATYKQKSKELNHGR